MPYSEIGCLTIVSKNYIANARVLCESFLENHPGATFFVILVDKNDGYICEQDEKFELLTIDEIGLPCPDIFPYQYNILELNTAVKPYALKHVFANYPVEKLCYIDPDILIFKPLEKVWEGLENHSVVLTPHMRKPLNDNAHPSELSILQSGTYNLGFIGLRRGETASKLLSWWSERLYLDCVVDIPRGLFTDQKWMDLVPGYFPDTLILHCPSYNVAYWNLHERTLTVEGVVFFADREPLSFFHYSGYDPRRPWSLSKHQNRHELKGQPVVKVACDIYGEKLFAAGFTSVANWPFAYNTLPNGILLNDVIRQVIRECLRNHLPFPSPSLESDDFCAFLLSPNRKLFGTPIAPLFHAILQRRPDVVAAFPRAFQDQSDDGFWGWVITSGVNEIGIGELINGWGHLARKINPVKVLFDTYRSRNDLQEAFPDALSHDERYVQLCQWGKDYGTVEIENFSVSDVNRVRAARGGVYKILCLYFQRVDLQKEFFNIFTRAGLARFKHWMINSLPQLKNVTEDDIELFYQWGVACPEILQKITLTYNVWFRENVGCVPNVFSLKKVHEFLQLVGVDLDRRQLFKWVTQELLPNHEEHVGYYYYSNPNLQKAYPDAFRSRNALIKVIDRILKDCEYSESDYINWIQQLKDRIDTRSTRQMVNVAGYFCSATGMGQSARSMRSTLMKAAVDVVEFTLPNCHTDLESLEFPTNGLLFGFPSALADTSIIIANADHCDPANKIFPSGYLGGKKIGYWVWETERLPSRWLDSQDYYDEIWTPSQFSKQAISSCVYKPVHVVPHVIDPVEFEEVQRAGDRAKFGLPAEAFIFGFFFDQKSIMQRKNPEAVIDAFCSAFNGNDSVYLLLKVNSSEPGNLAYEKLKARGRKNNIIWFEQTLNKVDTLELMASLDVYASLHRSEGFGFTLAEAAFLGKQIITTNYSGNVDFIFDGEAYMLKTKRVVTDQDYGPYPLGTIWGEPDIAMATACMVELYQNKGKKKYKLPVDNIVERLSPERVGALVADLLSREN
ncbi:MAG: glycosyltransferase family 4 protein [Desulforhopalus sp.]